MRKELELDPNLPAVLLMGGGEGMGPVEETARALGEELYDDERRRPIGQIVVICGRNRALRSSLQSLTWKVPVKVGNTTQESFHTKKKTPPKNMPNDLEDHVQFDARFSDCTLQSQVWSWLWLTSQHLFNFLVR